MTKEELNNLIGLNDEELLIIYVETDLIKEVNSDE